MINLKEGLEKISGIGSAEIINDLVCIFEKNKRNNFSRSLEHLGNNDILDSKEVLNNLTRIIENDMKSSLIIRPLENLGTNYVMGCEILVSSEYSKLLKEKMNINADITDYNAVYKITDLNKFLKGINGLLHLKYDNGDCLVFEHTRIEVCYKEIIEETIKEMTKKGI